MFKAFKDNVIIEPIIETHTKGGILLPERNKEQPQNGIVVSTGNETETLQVGDKVIFPRFHGQQLRYEGKEYLVMTEDSVLAVLEN